MTLLLFQLIFLLTHLAVSTTLGLTLAFDTIKRLANTVTYYYVLKINTYSSIFIRKYKFCSKGPQGLTWEISGLEKSSKPEGFSLGSTRGADWRLSH